PSGRDSYQSTLSQPCAARRAERARAKTSEPPIREGITPKTEATRPAGFILGRVPARGPNAAATRPPGRSAASRRLPGGLAFRATAFAPLARDRPIPTWHPGRHRAGCRCARSEERRVGE